MKFYVRTPAGPIVRLQSAKKKGKFIEGIVDQQDEKMLIAAGCVPGLQDQVSVFLIESICEEKEWLSQDRNKFKIK